MTTERHRTETSDAIARESGYYGAYDPRPDVGADEKLNAAINRYRELFMREVRCAAMNPQTIADLRWLRAGIAIIPRDWIPADTYYVGGSEKDIAP